MASPISPSHLFLFFISIVATLYSVDASVPTSSQFKLVNSGDFDIYIAEYNANYRYANLAEGPFVLCFYNTTPSAYTLAIRMGSELSDSLYRWVWEANRGNPVGENATLSFGRDGNLVLANADGRVAWQTDTANKGVVGIKMLSNGNIVLHDSKDNFIWQSFDFPNDILLLGQSLLAGKVTKLVSRASIRDNANGPYSLVMEDKRLALYYTSEKTGKRLLYFNGWDNPRLPGPLTNVTLVGDSTNNGYAFYINLESRIGNESYGETVLGRPKYNGMYSFLKLEIDGNLRVYTFNDKVDWGAWEVTFGLFDEGSVHESMCQLPSRCGELGLCSEGQCVACPLESGLMGWSEDCAAAKVTSCKPSDFRYYKVEGVDHFLSKYTTGSAAKETDCEAKCTKDCKCLGYFHNQDTSRCWLAYELDTLTKVANSTHVGYIKVPNK